MSYSFLYKLYYTLITRVNIVRKDNVCSQINYIMSFTSIKLLCGDRNISRDAIGCDFNNKVKCSKLKSRYK